MDGVLQRFGDEFRRNPVEFIEKMNSALAKVAGRLVALSKFCRDTLQRLEALVATNLHLKNALRIAVRKLHGITREVREYVELVKSLRDMANDEREAAIRKEFTDRREWWPSWFWNFFRPPKRQSFPKLEAFLEELNSRIVARDRMRGIIERHCNELMAECTRHLKEAEEKENEAGSWEWMLLFVAMALAVGGVGAAIGGLRFIAFGASTVATSAVVGSGAAGVCVAGFSGAHTAYKKLEELSKLETDFRQVKEAFDELRRNINWLHLITESVVVPESIKIESASVKTESKCCEPGELPESLENLFRKLRSIDLVMAKNALESINVYVGHGEHED